jgi:hypothetical protein
MTSVLRRAEFPFVVDDLNSGRPLTPHPPGSLLAVPAADAARRVSRITLDERVTWDKKIDFLLRYIRRVSKWPKTFSHFLIFWQRHWILGGFVQRLAFPVLVLQKWRR